MSRLQNHAIQTPKVHILCLASCPASASVNGTPSGVEGWLRISIFWVELWRLTCLYNCWKHVTFSVPLEILLHVAILILRAHLNSSSLIFSMVDPMLSSWELIRTEWALMKSTWSLALSSWACYFMRKYNLKMNLKYNFQDEWALIMKNALCNKNLSIMIYL
jgi:hypothetical protein